MDDSKAVQDAASQLSKLGASKGGKARASVLTPEERTEIARGAVIARWKRAKGKDYQPPAPVAPPPSEKGGASIAAAQQTNDLPYSMFQGKLHLGNIAPECHVLNDGRRVFTQREVVRILTGGTRTGDLKRYLSGLPGKVADSAAAQIQFKIPGNPTPALGSEATLLVEICDAYLRAREEDDLRPNQLHIARQAEIITRACAKVGIIALVDEATGYQQYRAKRALQLKLQAFIAEDIQDWARMFPEEFWHELARLEGVKYSPRSRPLRWGKYVMVFVYDAVDKDVGKKLREINPDPHFRQNHHQWLKEFGRERVGNQLQQVIGAMKTCETIEEFKSKFARAFKKLPTQMPLDFGEISVN